MDAYTILFVFIGLIVVLWVFKSVKKDIERGEKILYEAEKVQKTLSQLLNEAIETIEELDSFGEYIIERIENKVKWAKNEVLDTEKKTVKVNVDYQEAEEYVNQTETEDYEVGFSRYSNMQNTQKEENKKRSKEELYKKAVELYKQGYTVEQIASDLNIGKGEAKLAIRIVGREKI